VEGTKPRASSKWSDLGKPPGIVSNQASWSNSPRETITADVQTPFLGKFQKVCDTLRSREVWNWHFDTPHQDTLQFNIPRITLTCCCCLLKIQYRYSILRYFTVTSLCCKHASLFLIRDAAKRRRREILHVCIQFIGFLTITSSQKINPGMPRIIPAQERKPKRDYKT